MLLKVLWKPFRNPVSRGFKGFQTIWERFGNSFETPWKPFRNPVLIVRNPLETLWNPLKLFRNPLETLWKLFRNALETRFQ